MGDEGKERCKDGKNKGKNREDRTKDQDWVLNGCRKGHRQGQWQRRCEV